MKRRFTALTVMFAVACSVDTTTPTREPTASVTATSSTSLVGTSEVEQKPGQKPSPSASAAVPSPFDAVDRLASSRSQDDAFKVLDAVGAAEDDAKVLAQWSCYQALALFTLNQVTAGSVAADHCTAKAPVDQARWRARLDTAKENANTRVKQALAGELAQECSQAIADKGQPIGGGCATCIKVGDFSDQLKKTLDAKSLRSIGVLHPAVTHLEKGGP